MCTRKHIQEFPCSIVCKVKNWKQPNVCSSRGEWQRKCGIQYTTNKTEFTMKTNEIKIYFTLTEKCGYTLEHYRAVK